MGTFILCFVIAAISFSFLLSNSFQIYAMSPPFSLQQISDDSMDWINMSSKLPLVGNGSFVLGLGPTNIKAISYFSDGETLNATLWTHFPFTFKPTEFEQVNYGMLIDSDFDKYTGFGGIDYLFQIGWDNKTKTWNKGLWELSMTGEQKTLIYQHNISGFFEKEKAFIDDCPITFWLLSIELGIGELLLGEVEVDKNSSII